MIYFPLYFDSKIKLNDEVIVVKNGWRLFFETHKKLQMDFGSSIKFPNTYGFCAWIMCVFVAKF